MAYRNLTQARFGRRSIEHVLGETAPSGGERGVLPPRPFETQTLQAMSVQSSEFLGSILLPYTGAETIFRQLATF